MRRLASLERLLERLFERSSARVFRTSLEPIQAQRRMERALEEARGRTGGAGQRLPDRIAIRLAPRDLATLGDPEALATTLATAALAFARGHGYAFDRRPTVRVIDDRAATAGDPVVEVTWGAEPHALPGDVDRPGADAGAPIDATRVFVAPAVRSPGAVVIVHDRRGRRAVPLDGRSVTIGRGADNDLVLDDPRVSRRHARIQAREGRLVVTDLASANGVWLGGKRVTEAVLGPGDRVELGGAFLEVGGVS